MGVVERNQLWLKAKKMRLEDMKIDLIEAELQEMSKPTFYSKSYADKIGIN